MSDSIDILRTKTKTQLKEIVAGKKTKRDFLIEIVGSETIMDEPERKYREDNQIESQQIVYRDIETGAITGGQQTTWTYYDKEKGAPVDTITIQELNAKLKPILTKTIKHYTDGKQPDVSEV